MPRYTLDAFDDAAGPPVNVCPPCLGPRRDAVTHLVVEGAQPVPTCARCGGPVDAIGRSALLLTTNGAMQPVVVQLEDSLPVGEVPV